MFHYTSPFSTFSATLLPRVEKAGGGQYPPLAAGHPIVIIGGPEGGGKARRGTILAAPSAAASAIHDFKSTGRRFIRRDLVAVAFSRARDRLGAGITGWISATNHGQPVPSIFSGYARVQPSKQSPRSVANAFQDSISFGHPFRQKNGNRKGLSCVTKVLTGIAKCL